MTYSTAHGRTTPEAQRYPLDAFVVDYVLQSVPPTGVVGIRPGSALLTREDNTIRSAPGRGGDRHLDLGTEWRALRSPSDVGLDASGHPTVVREWRNFEWLFLEDDEAFAPSWRSRGEEAARFLGVGTGEDDERIGALRR